MRDSKGTKKSRGLKSQLLKMFGLVSNKRTLITICRGWFQNINGGTPEVRGGTGSLEHSLFGLERKDRPPLVPEVVVSHHSSENLANCVLDEDDEIRLELANRDRMAQTVQQYLMLGDSTPALKDKLFTAGLLVLTMLGILIVFWYQNFGPGFRAFQAGH